MLGLIVALLVLLGGILIYKFAYAPYGVLRKMGVRGPTPRPFWGNTREFVKDPFGMIQKLRDTYGDVFGFYIGATPALVIADQELLKLVLVKQFSSFSDRFDFIQSGVIEKLGLPPQLVVSKGEQWKHSRQIITPTFTSGKMKQMVPLLQLCADTLQADFEKFSKSEETIDMKRHFSVFTMESILATAFGRQADKHEGDRTDDPLIRAARTLFDAQRADGRAPDPFTVSAVKSQLPFIKYVMPFIVPKAIADSIQCLYDASKALIESRRREQQTVKHRDFLQLILDSETENCSTQDSTTAPLFSNVDLISHSITFLVAGSETTSSCLTFTSYLLAVYPDVQEKLCQKIDNYFKDHSISTDIYEAIQNIEYLDMVVQESLRIYPPAPLVVSRVCTEDAQLGDLAIPKGTIIIIPVMSIHQDQKIWEDPENFRPERFNAEDKEKRPQLCHLPFGWGPRNCLGMRFALMEIKIALVSILQKYKFVRTEKTEVPLQTVTSAVTLQPKNGVFLKIEQRN